MRPVDGAGDIEHPRAQCRVARRFHDTGLGIVVAERFARGIEARADHHASGTQGECCRDATPVSDAARGQHRRRRHRVENRR
jgi:hypothetical protein